MNIEQALKQNKKFKSPLEKAMVNVNYTSAQLFAHSAQLMTSFDLSMQQYNILRILRGKSPDPATVKYLIERMIDKSSNASRLVDKLVAKGLVDRCQCPNDRRQVDVQISKQGLNTLDLMEVEMQKNRKNFDHMSEKELESLSKLLDKLRDGIE